MRNGSIRRRLARFARFARLAGSEGNAPLELVLLAPVILALIGLVVAAGRVSTAQGAVDAAAHDAAREASLAPSQAAAQTAATGSANAALSADGLDCDPVVSLPNLGAAFGTPIGQPAEIKATVRCTVSLARLLVPGLPGSMSLSSTFSSPLDPYRSRDLAAGISPAVTALSHTAAQNQGTYAAHGPPGTPLRREEPDETTSSRRAG
jgi:hypothetical protein